MKKKLPDSIRESSTHILKPCPFCGAKAEVGEFNMVNEYTVGCTECPAWMEGFSSHYNAIKAWNTRQEATND